MPCMAYAQPFTCSTRAGHVPRAQLLQLPPRVRPPGLVLRQRGNCVCWQPCKRLQAPSPFCSGMLHTCARRRGVCGSLLWPSTQRHAQPRAGSKPLTLTPEPRAQGRDLRVPLLREQSRHHAQRIRAPPHRLPAAQLVLHCTLYLSSSRHPSSACSRHAILRCVHPPAGQAAMLRACALLCCRQQRTLCSTSQPGGLKRASPGPALGVAAWLSGWALLATQALALTLCSAHMRDALGCLSCPAGQGSC